MSGSRKSEAGRAPEFGRFVCTNTACMICHCSVATNCFQNRTVGHKRAQCRVQEVQSHSAHPFSPSTIPRQEQRSFECHVQQSTYSTIHQLTTTNPGRGRSFPFSLIAATHRPACHHPTDRSPRSSSVAKSITIVYASGLTDSTDKNW